MLEIFKKKHKKRDFCFVGIRQHIRTEEELLLEIADYWKKEKN